ncbi:RluA family pseudouridine synthase [Candidatus Saccharibacteria bacterium]|nr:RluA family pseudouridine synthase [Candidatus Saccharibacteria bacterium]
MRVGKKFSKPDLSRVINGDISPAELPEVAKEAKFRIDAWVADHYSGINRSQAQKLVKDGKVTVNGAKNVRSSLLVGSNDKIDVDTTPDPTKTGEMPTIYEDDDVLVLDKPIGVLTHAKGAKCDEFTVADFVKQRLANNPTTCHPELVSGSNATIPKQVRSKPEPKLLEHIAPNLIAGECSEQLDSGLHAINNRTGIVHRLDRGTSGVIITAKNEATQKFLQKQFANRRVKKTYYALVEGHLKQPAALIDLPIARNLKKPTTFMVDSNGRTAQTKYEVLQVGKKYSLIKLTPTTGRTHQLRVHLAYLGHPIVGDRVYNSVCKGLPCKTESFKEWPCKGRLYLHAGELEITLPGGKRTTFTSPLPPEFKEKLDVPE